MKRLAFVFFLVLLIFSTVLVYMFQMNPVKNEETIVLSDKLISAIINGQAEGYINKQYQSALHITHMNDGGHFIDAKEIVIDDVEFKNVQIGYSPQQNGIWTGIFEVQCPFGETIGTSKVYIDAVNKYTEVYGSPTKRVNDDINIYCIYNNYIPIGWYSSKKDYSILLYYKEGDIKNAEFPIIRTEIFPGNAFIEE